MSRYWNAVNDTVSVADPLPLPCVVDLLVLRSASANLQVVTKSVLEEPALVLSVICTMGSGPLRGSSKQQQQSGLPPWVSSVERVTSVKAGSVVSDLASAVAPETTRGSAVERAPIRVRVAKPTVMAGKDSSAFVNAAHTFVVFGASVSCQI